MKYKICFYSVTYILEQLLNQARTIRNSALARSLTVVAEIVASGSLFFCLLFVLLQLSFFVNLVVVVFHMGTRTLSQLCLFAQICICISAHTSLYVAPGGSDTNNGTIAAPLATWSKAKAVVRSLLSESPATIRTAVTVFFREGEYVLAETEVFGVQDSGSVGALVTYRNYPGERVLIRSGSALQWSAITKDDPFFEQLPNPSAVYRGKLTANARSNTAGATPHFLLDEDSSRGFSVIADKNAVYGLATQQENTSTTWYVGQTRTVGECQKRVVASVYPEAVAYTWHDPAVFTGEQDLKLYSIDNSWCSLLLLENCQMALVRAATLVLIASEPCRPVISWPRKGRQAGLWLQWSGSHR
jgi:hypothetical protein